MNRLLRGQMQASTSSFREALEAAAKLISEGEPFMLAASPLQRPKQPEQRKCLGPPLQRHCWHACGTVWPAAACKDLCRC